MAWVNPAVATFLWTYALVLALAWVRAVAAEPQKLHVAHVVQLLGVLVPVIAALLVLIVFVSVSEFGALLLIIPFLLPAGLILAFQLELSRLKMPSYNTEIKRVIVAVLLSAVILFLF